MAITASSIYLTVSGSDTIDLSVQSYTDSIVIGNENWWAIQALEITGLFDETVTYTIQTSLDDSNEWVDYNPVYYTAVPLKEGRNDDVQIRSVFMRLDIQPNTNNSGTCKFAYWTKP